MTNLGGMNGMGNSGSVGLGFENPAFKVKIVFPNDALQQRENQPRKNPADDAGDNLREGDPVSAKVGDREITGTIYALHRNDQNDVIFVEIKDTKGIIHKVNASQVRDSGIANTVPDDTSRGISTPGVFAESKFCSYDNFIVDKPSRFKSFLNF